jgi:short-subunit dehydrogenase
VTDTGVRQLSSTDEMDKTAPVTEPTDDIGKALAEMLAVQGFHVIVISRNEKEARAVPPPISPAPYERAFI